MNLPNKLTTLRMILVIPFITMISLAIFRSQQFNETMSYNHFNISTLYLLLAGFIFICAMLTDFIDGFIARKHQQITTFGKLFDPLADKFMTTSAMICLSILGLVPFWLILVFILRDLLVDGARNLAAKNNIVIAANWFGKSKTLILSLGIFILIFLVPLFKSEALKLSALNPSLVIYYLNFPLFLAAFFSTISGWQYFAQVLPYLKTK